jgi:biotin carboxyl carrier protein
MRGQKMSESGEPEAGGAKATPGTPNGASVAPPHSVVEATPGTPNGARTAPAGGAGRGGMFRQQALTRRNARDTLENLLTITSPRLWLALAACVVAISAAVVWAVTGSAPTTVSGFGIVLPASGVVNVTALAPGTVTSLPIVTGIQVAQGQTVAVLNARGGTTQVDAPVPGTIDQIYVTPGSFVGPGTAVAEMLPLGSPMSALMFVGAGEGKTLRVGMRADISPSTAPSSQYGSIRGVVTYISPLPLTQQRLVTLLGDRPGLVATVAQLGAPLEVAVTLLRDSSTPSGFAWTSGSGPGFDVTPGTLLTGTVLVSQQSPASIAFSSH